jgi:drug/metabolite transporter (DMT)-like permease
MASAFVAAKHLLNTGAPPTALAAIRFIVAGVIAGMFLVVYKSLDYPESLRDLLGLSLVGLLQTAVLFGTGFFAMVHLSAATVALFTLTMPIWVVLFESLIDKQWPATPTLLGAFMGVFGVALIVQAGISTGNAALIWYVLPLVGAVSWAWATIFTKRAGLAFSGWSLNAWQMLFGGSILAILCWWLDLPLLELKATQDWLAFSWLVIPGSILSFGLWFAALQIGGATVTSGYLFLVPFFTALLSMLMLDTHFSGFQIMGGVAVGLGIWLMSKNRSIANE